MSNIFRKCNFILLAFLAVLSSCKKDALLVNLAPTVITGNVEDVYRLGATVYGSLQNPNGYTVKEYGIQYSLYQSFAEPVNVEVTNSEDGNFSVVLSGLEPGTNYYYRTYAFSGYNTVYSEARSFTTTSTNAPIFGETTVSNITLTSFDVHAELLDNGGSDLMLSGFVYKQVENENITELTNSTEGAISEFCGTDFRMTVKDLYSGALYAVRPYGVSNGVGYGAITFVRTQSADQAIISSCTLSDSTFNSVRVEAHVLSVGTHPIVEAGFCYSSENMQPTVNNLHTQANLQNNTFAAVLRGLDSGVKYYIRAYTKDSSGEYVYSDVAEHTVIKNQVIEITTLTADNITTTNARLWGIVRSDNAIISERGFCWSTTSANPTLERDNRLKVETQEENYSANITVSYGKTYYYRAYAINAEGDVFYGKVLAFAAEDIALAVVMATEAKNITESSAVIGGYIVDIKGGNIKSAGFCWSSTNENPNIRDNTKKVTLDSNKESASFEATLENLQQGTTYYYRAYVENEKGISYSDVRTFTTNTIVTSVVLNNVTIIETSNTFIKVSASIIDDGRGTITEKGFCYKEGVSTPLITDIRKIVTTEGPDFSATILSLSAGTQYTIRAYAINEKGVAYSDPKIVETKKNDPSADDAVFPEL